MNDKTEKVVEKTIKDSWMRVEEVIEYLQISHQTLYNWIQEGKIKRYHLGKRALFMKSDVDGLITCD